jgi:sugar phosphate permease
MPHHDPRSAGVFYGWWIVASSFLFLFLFAGAGYYSFSIFIKPIEAEFGWSRAAISLTMSIQFLATGLAGPLVGRLTQTLGSRRLIALGALGAGASFMLVSLTQSLWYFYAVFALLGIFISAIGFIPLSSLLARWFVRRRGIATGMAMVGISAGGLLFAPMIDFVTFHFTWKTAFIFLGICVWIIGLPLALWVIRDDPERLGLLPDGDRPTTLITPYHPAPGRPVLSAASKDWPFRAAFAGRPFRWIGITFFLAAGAQSGILQHQVPIVSEAGMPDALAALALGLTAGFGGFGKICFGRIAEIAPYRLAAMLCFGLQALAILVLLCARGQVMIWAYILLFGFSMGGIVVLLPLAVGHFFGLGSFGLILGTLNLCQAFGGSLGAFLSGLLHDRTGDYQIGLTIFAGAYLAAAAAIFTAGKPERYEERKA